MPDDDLGEDATIGGASVWDVFALHLALPSIARLIAEAERKGSMPAEDLERCREALRPDGLSRGDMAGWIESVKQVQLMLSAANRLDRQTAPEHDQAEELRAD